VVQIRGEVCRKSFFHMAHIYSHLYWEHFVEPFTRMEVEKNLNTSFTHFLITGTSLGLLKPSDLEPMQAMIDLWAREGVFDEDSEIYKMANPESPSSPTAI
jgi:hypothetical protein